MIRHLITYTTHEGNPGSIELALERKITSAEIGAQEEYVKKEMRSKSKVPLSKDFKITGILPL